MKRLEGKCALITGAARGIGLAFARRYVAEGARVAIGDIDLARAREAAADIGEQAIAVEMDVSSQSSIDRAVAETVDRLGRIDILINNAAIFTAAPITEIVRDDYNRVFDINVSGTLFTLQAVARHMIDKGIRGRIINMASINGLVGFSGKAAYNSAKHGVIGLTKVAALEAAQHGITVNAVCPGYVDTPLVRNQLGDLAKTRNIPFERVIEEVIYPLVPQRRLLDVKEIADYTMFLCSDAAKGITGQAVVLDGGYTVQ